MCKPFVTKGMPLFPRSKGDASIRSHRGASARCVERETKKRTSWWLSNKSRTLTRRPLWIITSYQSNRMETLTIGPELDGGFLAAFSYEEEAAAFLWLLGDDEKMKGWRSEEMTVAELASVLLGPCADVKRVVLDPLPLPLGRAMLFVGGVNREAFLRCPSQERADIGIP